jgi:hypothetical protein
MISYLTITIFETIVVSIYFIKFESLDSELPKYIASYTILRDLDCHAWSTNPSPMAVV